MLLLSKLQLIQYLLIKQYNIMCLEIKSRIKPIPYISLWPKTYYKVLAIKEGQYSSPYQHSPVELNSVLQSAKANNIIKGIYRPNTWLVKEGWFHLYKNKCDAGLDIRFLNQIKCARHLIVKATIPAFTRYLKGKFYDADCICTKRVKYSLIK